MNPLYYAFLAGLAYLTVGVFITIYLDARTWVFWRFNHGPLAIACIYLWPVLAPAVLLIEYLKRKKHELAADDDFPGFI